MSENTENTATAPEVEEKAVESGNQEKQEGKGKVALPVYFGLKAGMTRIFNEEGKHVPVTVIKLVPNVISQVKTKEKDGYEAYQVAYFEKREKLINKAKKGHLSKAGTDLKMNRFAEIKNCEISQNNLGSVVSLEAFEANTYVDVSGVSKGKGFQGVIKRFGFSGGPASHGSKFHRAPGSIGNCATPARVRKGKKMPGHMGSETVTTQNLKIVEVNEDKGYMLIKGSIPGHKNAFVKIAKSVKKA